jgi:predicted XRE-type DNA-binding protein
MSTSETDTPKPLFWIGSSRKVRKRTSVKTERIEPSSGNVFADLGLKNPEELLAKAEIVQRISDVIAERKLTQAGAAKLLGIDQPKVSALLRGKLEGFSIDRLFRFLNALGRDVEITIRPARRAEYAETRVV